LRLATPLTTKLLLMRQLPPEDRLRRSLRPDDQTHHPMCAAGDLHLNGRHGSLVRGKRNPEHTSRVITTHLTSGAVTAHAQSKAVASADLEQRFNPKLKQRMHELQLEEFLETVKSTQCADDWNRGGWHTGDECRAPRKRYKEKIMEPR
jgi:hypothetical protein